MTDSRLFTLEDEIDVLHDDLGRARRRYDDKLRARFDGRMVNQQEFNASLAALRGQIRRLERSLADALAAQQAADEAYEQDQA